MQTSIATQRNEAIELIQQLENEDLLAFIVQLLKSSQTEGDWAEHLSDAQKSDIREGLSDLENGRTVKYEEFKESMKKRFP